MAEKGTATAAQYTDSTVDGGFSHPVLEKIRKLLTSTDPDKWGIGGEDLSDQLRYERPRKAHEQVLVRDLPNGSLVLHAVQPIECHYGPGGYAPRISGAAVYTIEVRDRVFDPEKLVNPKYAANFLGKRCDVIASGDIAKSLFLQVRSTIREVLRERKRHFDEIVATLSADLMSKVKKLPFAQWEKTSSQQEETKTIHYRTTIDEVTLCISRESCGFNESYSARFERGSLSNTHLPRSIARECFRFLEESEQECQLQKLDSTLRDLGLE